MTPITGYRTLSAEEIDLINRVKAAGEVLMTLQKEIATSITTHSQTACAARYPDDTEATPEAIAEWDRITNAGAHGWAVQGRRDIQTGCMALVRAIAQPQGV